MSEQYFTKNPSTLSRIASAVWAHSGQEYEFLTDSGVFSRAHVDFGSKTLIECLPNLTGRVLDLGCGYGFIGLAVKILNPQADVVLCDVNQRALSLARENAKRLNLLVDVRESDGYSGIDGRFDAILTNPPVRAGKAVYYPWFEGAPERLNLVGALYVVLQRKQGAPSAAKRLGEMFPHVETIARDAGYHVLAARRTSEV